jgi:hypothetical protein
MATSVGNFDCRDPVDGAILGEDCHSKGFLFAKLCVSYCRRYYGVKGEQSLLTWLCLREVLNSI